MIVSKNSIKDDYEHIISVDNGKLQNLLHFEYPFACSTSKYGYDCSYYKFDLVVISTGSRPLNSKGVTKEYKKYSNEICGKYEKLAKECLDNKELSYEVRKDTLRDLIDDFIKEVIQ